MIGVLLLGLKWGGLLFGVALLISILIPIKLDHRSCRRCAYDMTGVPGMKCPECGRSVKQEKKLWRKRIRKRRVGLMLLLLATSYAGSVGERVAKHGWPQAVPSTLLIAGYPSIERNRQSYLSSTGQYSCRHVGCGTTPGQHLSLP